MRKEKIYVLKTYALICTICGGKKIKRVTKLKSKRAIIPDSPLYLLTH